VNYHWRQGNELELLINGDQFFPCVFDCIRRAQSEVLIETFIIAADEVGIQLRDALLDAAGRGVSIEITVDGYGTAELESDYIAELVEAGISFRMFEPKRPLFGIRTNIFRRLHRKIIVVDRETAMIGGINFAADHLRGYGAMAKQDYALRLKGPVVGDLYGASRDLLADYAGAERRPFGEPPTRTAGNAAVLLSLRDNARNRTDIEKQYLQGIQDANERIVLANAYFFPGYRLLRSLRNASGRGVRVVIILQGKPDKQYTRMLGSLLYGHLLRHGIEIYEYLSHPFHGKIAIIDHEWATIGSSNLDPLSLYLNLEANVFTRDVDLNGQLHAHLAKMIERDCSRVSFHSVNRKRWWQAPLIFLSFHFLRRFPSLAGLLPGHTPRIQSLSEHRKRRRQGRVAERSMR